MQSEVTIYVLLGREDARKPVCYFITKNGDLKVKLHRVRNWKQNAFMPLRAIEPFEDKWDILKKNV
jgi:hypothetical protein